jgi:hypothetical protein
LITTLLQFAFFVMMPIRQCDVLLEFTVCSSTRIRLFPRRVLTAAGDFVFRAWCPVSIESRFSLTRA